MPVIKSIQRSTNIVFSRSPQNRILPYAPRMFVYDKKQLNAYGILYAVKYNNGFEAESIHVRVWDISESIPEEEDEKKMDIIPGDDRSQTVIVDVVLAYARTQIFPMLIIGDLGTTVCCGFGNSIVIWSLCTGKIIGHIASFPLCTTLYSNKKMWKRDSVIFAVDTVLSTLQLIYCDKMTGLQQGRRQIVMSGSEVSHITHVAFDQSSQMQFAVVTVRTLENNTRLWWVPLYTHESDSQCGRGMEYAVLLRNVTTTHDAIDRDYSIALRAYHIRIQNDVHQCGKRMSGVDIPVLSADSGSVVVDKRVYRKAVQCAKGVSGSDNTMTYYGKTHKVWVHASEFRAVIQLERGQTFFVKGTLPCFMSDRKNSVPCVEQIYNLHIKKLFNVTTPSSVKRVSIGSSVVCIEGSDAQNPNITAYYCAQSPDTPFVIAGTCLHPQLTCLDNGMRIFEIMKQQDSEQTRRRERLICML